MHISAGVRQALRMLVVSTVVAAVAALVWLLLADGGYRPKLGLSLMLVAGLLCLAGGTGFGRLEDADVRAYLGRGPARDDPVPDGALTPVGVFLLVALPLVLVGGFVHGRG